MEQELTAGLSERQVAKLVEDDEVHPSQVLGNTTLPSVTGLDLQAINEVNHIVEATTGARTDATSGDGYSQMGLAGSSATDQNGVALLGNKAAAGEIID